MDRAMHHVTLYSRAGCHLCDDAETVLDDVRREVPFDLDVIDVDDAASLRAQYGQQVPVVAVDGEVAFVYRVDPAALRARLARDGGGKGGA